LLGGRKTGPNLGESPSGSSKQKKKKKSNPLNCISKEKSLWVGGEERVTKRMMERKKRKTRHHNRAKKKTNEPATFPKRKEKSDKWPLKKRMKKKIT